MEVIGTASAILGVAQFSLQFSQVLITVIGDYRDAAKHINRLRDEIHLSSIALQQLGDLASRDLLRQYGILEATNLRDRLQAVFLEIRRTIRKEYAPSQANQITKEEIDVTRFTSFRWALWTKKQLEEPRQELDRLKSSMTLCFVSHMAILARTDLERSKYASQIPGIKKSLAWSSQQADNDHLRGRLLALKMPPDKIDKILNDEEIDSKDEFSVTPDSQPNPPVANDVGVSAEALHPILKAWNLDPLSVTGEIPVSQPWLQRFITQQDIGDQHILHVHAKLHPWFKNELQRIISEQSTNTPYNWTIVLIERFYRHIIKHGAPQCIQVVLRGIPKSKPPATQAGLPITENYNSYSANESKISPNSGRLPGKTTRIGESTEVQVEYIDVEPKPLVDEESDEEIIAKQLALYQ